MKSVILPVAGKGTRLLPLTKVTPKELLPVFDKPVLQYSIDEAVSSGAERLIVITHKMKPAIADYFNCDEKAVAALRRKKRDDLADLLEQSGADQRVDVKLVYQEEALGLGHAILCAAEDVLDGPVGVILPDDVIIGKQALVEMSMAYTGGNMVAAMHVPRPDVSKYGVFEYSGDVTKGHRTVAQRMVEKPTPAEAPSQMAAVGRYILDPSIFETLRSIPRGTGGEYQLTDVISAMICNCELSMFPFSGKRYDCGNHLGLLAAANARSAQLGITHDSETVAA